jgi:hypothetical protein
MAVALQFSLTYPNVPAYAALKIVDYTDEVELESSKENSCGAMAR